MGIVPGHPNINLRIRNVEAGPEDCWLVSTCRPDGYAQVGRPPLLAHRIAWEVHNGRSVRDGHEIHHECRTRCCVNPAHLAELSTAEHRLVHGSTRTLSAPPSGECLHGHDWAACGVLSTQGRWICLQCRRDAGARHDAKRRAKS